MEIADAERQLIEEVLALYSSASILIGHNSKAFDRNFLNGVCARHDLPAPPPRFHIDTYHVARYGLKGIYQSVSLDNLADILHVGVKDRPSKHDWREASIRDEEALERIRERCESDVRLTAAVWSKLMPYWVLWRGDR
jgi:DNA polymerase III epsilon subunit-like protein